MSQIWVEDITNAVEEETTSSEDPEIWTTNWNPQEELEEDIQGASEYDEINEEARDSVIQMSAMVINKENEGLPESEGHL